VNKCCGQRKCVKRVSRPLCDEKEMSKEQTFRVFLLLSKLSSRIRYKAHVLHLVDVAAWELGRNTVVD